MQLSIDLVTLCDSDKQLTHLQLKWQLIQITILTEEIHINRVVTVQTTKMKMKIQWMNWTEKSVWI